MTSLFPKGLTLYLGTNIPGVSRSTEPVKATVKSVRVKEQDVTDWASMSLLC